MTMKIKFSLFIAIMWFGLTFNSVNGQTTTFYESFDEIGASATATLPGNWKADKQTTARVVGTYSGAVTTTEQRAGISMSSSATNGIYNYGDGDPLTATNRCVGFISSGSATKSGNLYCKFNNAGLIDITSVPLSYNIKKYRNGSNTAGFSIQLYYSFDGNTWTSAGNSFLTNFAADANNNGNAVVPITTINVAGNLTVTIPAGSNFYLCWNYAVTSGTTTSNAQALGIDDVTITDVPLPVKLTSFTSTVNDRQPQLMWTTASEINNAGFDVMRKEKKEGAEWTLAGAVRGHGTTNEPHDYVFVDSRLNTGVYEYKLVQRDYNGNIENYLLNEDIVIGTPKNFDLEQNFPNPFNPTTHISFTLPERQIITFKVYDILGQELLNKTVSEWKDAGFHTITFNVDGLSSGIYFYSLSYGTTKTIVKKMTIVK